MPEPQRHRARDGAIGFVMFVGICFVGVWLSTSDSSSQSAAAPTALVFIGQRGVIKLDTFGCPELKDLNQLASDVAANDRAGFYQHYAANGCVPINPGETGLDLDSSVWSGANKIRLDDRLYEPLWVATSRGGAWVPVGSGH